MCAVVSEHSREVHCKLFAFPANGQSPAEPRPESYRLEPGLQQVQYHVGRRQGRIATEANLATGRRPSEMVAIVLDAMKAVSERLFSAATLGSKASSNQP